MRMEAPPSGHIHRCGLAVLAPTGRSKPDQPPGVWLDTGAHPIFRFSRGTYIERLHVAQARPPLQAARAEGAARQRQ